MKQLLLVRHAKSDWNNSSLSDFERPLNERGKRDAPAMAQRLVDKKIQIDILAASPARRARKTAIAFAEVYGFKKDDIVFFDELYAAPLEAFHDVVSRLSDKAESAAIFSHNPGITDFANQLTAAKIDNIPTTGIFAVKAGCKHWSDFKNAKKEFLFFDYPKNTD
jgi:phosphohistidine phosphatase